MDQDQDQDHAMRLDLTPGLMATWELERAIRATPEHTPRYDDLMTEKGERVMSELHEREKLRQQPAGTVLEHDHAPGTAGPVAP